MSALDRYSEYIAFRNRGTSEELVAPDESDGPAVWMIRAGRGGQYAPDFVGRSAAIVGWGLTGDVNGLTRDAPATIALTLTEQPRDFHTGSPLTPNVIEASKVDDHHVFPRAYLKPEFHSL